MSRDVVDEIKREVAAHPILIYMKGSAQAPRCGFSARAIGILGELGVPVKDIDVLADPDKWQAVRAYSDWPTIPQVYIGGQFVGGGDQLVELKERGELKALVEKATKGA